MSEQPATLPVKRRNGRPTKFNAELAAKICDSVGEGLPICFAASLAGTSTSSVHLWQQKFPHFRQAIEEARARGLRETLKTIRDAARTDWRAAAWRAEHIFPEHFARNRLEISGPDGAPLQGGNVLIYLPEKETSIIETEVTRAPTTEKDNEDDTR